MPTISLFTTILHALISPLILRPALIGLALAAIIVSFLILVPRKAGEQNGALPPLLFPMYTDTKTEDVNLLPPTLVEIRKFPHTQEVSPGSTTAFTITVRNVSAATLTNLTLDERLDTSLFTILDAEYGSNSENRISWVIPVLDPSEVLTVRYTVQVQNDAPTMPIQTTAYVYGDDLLEMTSASRMASADVSIIALPISGVELWQALRWLNNLW